MGARITFSMNVKTNVEIGHPTSSFIWDIITTAENCFTFMKWKLYVGEGYKGKARSTAAQTERTITENIHIINEPMVVNGPVIYAKPDGFWEYSEDKIVLKDCEEMPFGPVAIQVQDFEDISLSFPVDMLSYLIATIERGEEPLEAVGRGNYSAVSGWKAYARWMQSYSIPLRNIIHPYQEILVYILYERRYNFVIYLQELAKVLLDTEKEMIEELFTKYRDTLQKIINVCLSPSYSNIRDVYFLEQMILPTLKEIRNHIKRYYS